MEASHAVLRQMMLSLELWLLSCWLYLITDESGRLESLDAAGKATTLGNPTTTRFGRLNARKKHNLPYIETIHIQLGRCWSAGLRPSRERFIIVPWKMLKSFLKKRMLNPFRNCPLTSTIWFTSTTKTLFRVNILVNTYSDNSPRNTESVFNCV